MARSLYRITLGDSFYASSAVVPIMNRGFMFTRGVEDPEHPECSTKQLMLTETEAASLRDRFTVEAVIGELVQPEE